MKKVLAVLIVIALSLVAGFAGGIYYAGNHGDKYDSETIGEQVLEASELTTLNCEYTDEGKYTGDAKKVLGFNLPFTSKEMIIRYSGNVKMGPDLENEMEVAMNEAGDKVTVSIPHSQILSHEVNEDSLKIIYIKNGVFNSVTPENTNQLRKDMKAKKTKEIKKGDYLEQADDRAVEQITTFLNSAYPDLDVEVEVK